MFKGTIGDTMQNRFFHTHKPAFFLLCLVLFLAVFSLGSLIFSFHHSQNGSLTACIYQDGVLIERIPLSEVTEDYSFTISSPSGGCNTICVRPDAIAVTAADCPDQICVHQGFRHSTLLPIICAPNSLVIRLSAAKPSSIDAVTH